MRRKRAQRKNGCFRCVRFLRNGSRGAGRLEKKWSRAGVRDRVSRQTDSTSSTNGTLQDTRMKLRRTRRQVNPGPPYQYHLVFQTGRHND
ncbi:hypothetical protein AcW1_008482 [Taiwanofungus camphoratus]|nr:hypothetical protein AcW1_008482 [Antrodia cinnamomea]